ncbi:SpoIIE family protein phosphatase [Sulfurimonas sp. SAG-AH-194-I05]|nr:SpoIIE family protein phosphatase [Sulfurimonas sp. SAG-AH-194-I05]MDF1875907.1 SpoIIE family protein phosphatase [Sulfurimonas sp. SAG-AH-194-I05]
MSTKLKQLKHQYFKNKNIFTLNFIDKSMEKKYRKDIESTKILQMRYAPLLTTIIYMLLAMTDSYLINDTQRVAAQTFHISMIFALLIPVFLSFYEKAKNALLYSLGIAPLYASLGNIYLLSMGISIYQPDIYLILIWVFVMPGLLTNQAFIVNAIITATSILVFLVIDIFNTYQLIVHIMYITIAWIIGIFAVYMLDYFNRCNYERKIELNKKKDFIQTLIDSQEQLIITTDGKKLITVNETFLDFFAVDSIEIFSNTYNTTCICDTFNTSAPKGFLQIQMGRELWIDYVISRSFGEIHKAMITIEGTDFIFSVTATKFRGEDTLKSAIFTNITEMENAKKEIESINKYTRESIEYAALIQSTLIPENKLFQNYFQDHFTVWQPKDTVGGDIYLFEELRDKDECLLMLIDCTGHGVPGAFVTMLVKAIERQVIAEINNTDDRVSPAKILSIFNKNMKKLLKQENTNSISNVGFDGAIIYYNKKEKILKFAGAETPLFYIENKELKIIKGSRYSVGYKKCAINYAYTEHTLKVQEGMQFYLTTDGYLHQNGGEKNLPFGKKIFKKTIEKYYQKTMKDQEKILLAKLESYQDKEERTDDVTLIGFTI